MTQADPKTIFNRFGGEGEGAHTHMLWPWEEGQTFEFFVQKQHGAKADTIDARYYVFDRRHERWIKSATITSPQGGKRSVATFGGGLNSFLENFAGRDKDAPQARPLPSLARSARRPDEMPHPCQGRWHLGTVARRVFPGRGRVQNARGRVQRAGSEDSANPGSAARGRTSERSRTGQCRHAWSRPSTTRLALSRSVPERTQTVWRQRLRRQPAPSSSQSISMLFRTVNTRFAIIARICFQSDEPLPLVLSDKNAHSGLGRL